MYFIIKFLSLIFAVLCEFFFFKQKTAYEMRISDWSSDVCSSDLSVHTPFPNGDVDRAKGVCTDVVIRAFRDALGADLQALVNADMRANFGAYPKNWKLGRPDRNIDHRRVPNLATYWRRQGASLPVTGDPADWRPGDLFTQMVGGRMPHTGIVSDRKDTTGVPLVLHNIGAGTREEDALFDHRLTGHFRWKV